MTLRYMVIGAGGTGAPLGAFLAKNGADVTLIARGAHLAAMQEKGLRFEQSDGETWTVPVKAFDMDGFLAAKAQGAPSPDVIFVCVKGYSLDDTIPFIRSAAGEKTVVIPILNIYGTGRTMQAQLPGLLVTDGCIYISSNLAAPGVIQRHGSIFRMIFGTPDHRTDNPVLCRLVGEILELARAMGIELDDKPDAPLMQSHLKILDDLAESASTSMQRDIEAGKNSEVDGLIYQVVRLADKYGLACPEYRKVAKKVKAELAEK